MIIFCKSFFFIRLQTPNFWKMTTLSKNKRQIPRWRGCLFLYCGRAPPLLPAAAALFILQFIKELLIFLASLFFLQHLQCFYFFMSFTEFTQKLIAHSRQEKKSLLGEMTRIWELRAILCFNTKPGADSWENYDDSRLYCLKRPYIICAPQHIWLMTR